MQFMSTPQAGELTRIRAGITLGVGSLLVLGSLGSPDLAQAGTHRIPGLASQPHPHDSLARVFTIPPGSAASHPSRLSCQEVGGTQELHQRDLRDAQEASVTLHGLKAETRYSCWTETSGGQRSTSVSFITAPLPYDLKTPTISVPSSDVARTGYILYNYGTLHRPWTVKNRYMVVLDPTGNVRWYYSGDGGGDVDISFLGNDRFLMGGYHDTSVEPTIIGLDKQIYFKDPGQVTREYESADSCNHDAGLAEDGQSIYTLAYSSDGVYGSFIIRELDVTTGDVLWTWSGIEDGVMQGQIPGGSSSDTDPHHANAIDDQIENGREYLYVSMRNQNQVMKLDKETGDVVWLLGLGGDFTLYEADGTLAEDHRWFFNQHDAKVYGPTLFSAHDNGTERNLAGGTNYSRALQLKLDQQAMTATIQFEYTEPSWVEPIWSGYDVLPDGRGLLAIGHCWLCTIPKVAGLVELSAGAQPLWRADFKSEKEHIYRAQRIDGCELFSNRTYCPSGKSARSEK